MLGDDGNRYVSAHFGRKIFLNNQGTKQPGRQTLFFCCFDVQSLQHPHSAFRIPHWKGSFPVFILGWMIGGSARVPRAGSGVAPESSLDKSVG
jgi:hypothetical protein